MPFSNIAGHSKAIAAIRRILDSGRVAHAYLFTGPEGIGKKKVATAFIEALFCGGNEGCGQCPSCRKIAGNNHPDIHTIEPDGQFIKVDQVRELQKALAFRPYEAQRKACIIDGADRFNPSSGNSLLKTLEEPPGNALMILLASYPDAVLSTIRSRCQIIPFSGIPEEEIAAFLEQNGTEQASAKIAASLSGGSMSKALSLCNEEIMSERTDIINRACSLSTGNMSELFAFGELFDKDREKTVQAIELLTGFWRDMLHLASGSSELANNDMMQLLQREAGKRTTESILRGIEALGRTRQAILRNGNIRLTMDVLGMQLAI